MMLLVMLASIALKSTKQTGYSAMFSSSLYTERELDIQRTFRKSPGRLLSILCALNLRPVSMGSIPLLTSHQELSWEQCQTVICLLSHRL